MRVAAVVNTLLVGLAATVSTYFKFKERSLNHQAFADTLETELRAAELRIGDYVGKSDDAVLEQLIARVESARAEHNLLERQLDQASEVTLPTLPEGGSER
ncbi:hypothetical protein SAMN05661093_03609 [Kibdelosporangium aridum]|uniref:Uncharacterized protein n=2 Tax=Kibdelosporangium aridum TaxID=2030 RepID=A0A1W2DN53_KIBAR|nr:hypothetical protein SAMN05661093_03609 [Kibdelosporangium aridum]